MFNKNKITKNKEADVVEQSKANTVVDKRERILSLPKQLMIGFYANIKPADLKNYLFAKAKSNMLPDNTYYAIKKFENGYLWELQEGGAGKGILSSVVEKLKTVDDIIIETADRPVRIMRKSSGDGISAFILNEDDKVTPTEGVVYKEKLKPVVRTGFGPFITSLVFAGAGVLAAASTLIFKYGLFHQPEPLKFVIEKEELPVSQMDAISWVLEDPNSYLTKLTYSKKDGWQMDKQVEEQKPKDNSETLENVNKQIEALKDKLNLEADSAGDKDE